MSYPSVNWVALYPISSAITAPKHSAFGRINHDLAHYRPAGRTETNLIQLFWQHSMRYEHQKRLRSELNARIPRGLRGSRQNQFRYCFWFFRSQGNCFDASIEQALSYMRATDPGFAPKIVVHAR